MKNIQEIKKSTAGESEEITWYPVLASCVFIWLLGCNQSIVDFLTNQRGVLIVLLAFLYLSAFFYVVVWCEKRDTATVLRFILIGSFIFRAYYVLLAPYDISYHDQGAFTDLESMESGNGHLGFIEYLYNNGHLPDFDPRQRWSFYNPPFFHILGALILKFTHTMGVPAPLCYESIQIINLFAASMTIWLLYKILDRLVERKTIVLLFTAMIAFHPFFVLYSAELTNDMVCMCFMALAFYYTLRWHEEHTLSSILIIALGIGLSMFAKLNAAVISFGIGFIFLWDFWNNRQEYKKYIVQFLSFLAVCAPIGLFWPIRNYVLFKMPLLYVQELTQDNPQYISETVLKRIGFSSNGQLTYPFVKYDANIERNIWTQLFRTSLFDEINPPVENNMMASWGLLLLWITILLALILNAALVWCLWRKEVVRAEIKIFMLVEYLAMLISYIKFCFDEPFICTMNYRYISLSMLFPILGGAFWLCCRNREKPEGKKDVPWVLNGLGYCLILSFIIVSFIIELYMMQLVPGRY